ncbi:MAG TPA: HAD-IC family P-type ATPase, partial [Flavobacteriaceae bacterium]|nr:HAD-IC family P-type ATPase [Flavobacteriaceae bacterium]
IWLLIDPSKAFFVFTAVLIIACPCAIALAGPFTLGNSLRIFGRNNLYLKEASVIEKMAQIDTVVFDKTGTLTTSDKNIVHYEGIGLSQEEENLLTGTLRASNHPLSRALYKILHKNDIRFLDDFEEKVGKGMAASYQDKSIKVGSFNFVNSDEKNQQPVVATQDEFQNKTTVHISVDEEYKGCYVFNSEYRQGLSAVFNALSENKKLIVLSGDNEGERKFLEEILPRDTTMYFNQKPNDKLAFIKDLQNQGKNVMMVGDGLNDAGALKQSDVGIVVSENTNVFTPACDGILDAKEFHRIPNYMTFSKQAISTIKWAFIFSLFYNVIGTGFAVTGHLQPVVAAILMPLSSISIVVFTTLATQFKSKKILD